MRFAEADERGLAPRAMGGEAAGCNCEEVALPRRLVPVTASCLLLALWCLGGCGRTEVEVFAYGLPPERVHVEVEELSAGSEAELQAQAGRADIDGAALEGAHGCASSCRGVLVTLFIDNASEVPLPPPVARLSSPEGKPRRLPVAFSGQQISPGRTGRLRLLVALWPEERSLKVRLSGSVRVEVRGGSGAPLTTSGP